LDIPGIPDSIPRKRCIELIENLGLDPEDIASLEFKFDGIYAEVVARNEDGKRHIVDGRKFAKHRIYIPIKDVDGEPT
jgi:hypothetical protein